MTKRFVRSWDVFDTLITRRWGSPRSIFDQMAALLGEDFADARIQAELAARAAKKEISLDDIYDHLQALRGWSAEVRRDAQDLEIRTELENVIPIAENIARVRDGDILVSDMYLPKDVILSLVRSAGLERDVTLYVSTHGKADGTMWTHLKGRHFVLKHTGDNPHADFLRPLRHFVPAALTDSSAESDWERVLRCNGMPALSAYVREMRLRTFDRRETASKLLLAQIEANFPLLLLASASLVHWCAENRVSRALMASRDCVLWAPLAQKVASHAKADLQVEYFLISRVAALKSSQSYLDYAARRLTSDSVVVDLSMTGVSLAGLADRLGIAQVRGFVIAWHQNIASSLYGDRFRPRARVMVDFLHAEVEHSDLEALNQATSPSVHDVSEGPDGLRISYAGENRSAAVLDAVREQNAAFLRLTEGVPLQVLDESLRMARSSRLVFLVRECENRAALYDTIVTRARPGSALSNDPNGIALNLPYTSQSLVPRWITGTLKGALRPLTRPGSFLRRYGKIPKLVVQALRRRGSRS